MTVRAWLFWSSGKDSAYSLHVLRAQDGIEVMGLVTTVHRPAKRVAVHAVRESLLWAQARACGLPLITVPIPEPCPNTAYETAIGNTLEQAKAQGVNAVVFGDLFLEDIRAYRESLLANSDLRPLFPLWGRDTGVLASEMIAAGLRAHITCIDIKVLPHEFAGRTYDAGLLRDLPDGVDPCGENGEFHTFAYAGPMFRQPIPVFVGKIIERDGFVYADVIPRSREI
ncbi:MAG: ATP-binding protein [Acidiferrobacterales bacterium]